MAYTTIDNPELYFQTKLYTGNGSSRSITFDGDEDMQPDWCWFKARSQAYNHALFDSVRGTTKLIRSNQTTAEETHSTTLTAFNSNGFSLGGGDAFTNANSVTYASWNWKAGGSASSNSNGDITSSVSANTTAGFSIVSYTGTGSAATVGHGLGVAPKLIIIKNRSSAESWRVYHNALGATKEIYLDLTASAGTSSSSFNDTEPTSSVFSVGTGNGTNKSSENLIAYCFSEVKSFSKFGSFTGNGNDDGPFVYTGFEPAWLLTKNASSSSEWHIYDNKRVTFNPNDNVLSPNANYADSINANCNTDFLSNGFKLRNSNSNRNENGSTHIYMAFAESPFINSNRIPNNAR